MNISSFYKEFAFNYPPIWKFSECPFLVASLCCSFGPVR